MSRNSKNRRLILQARAMSSQRKGGNKGPARTSPKHNKRQESCAWFQKKHNIAPKKGRRPKEEVEAETETK